MSADRIAVVSADDPARCSIRQLLELAGFDVDEFADKTTYERCGAARCYRCVIFDDELGTRLRSRAARAAASRARSVPAIMLVRDRSMARDAPASRHARLRLVGKPIGARNLYRAVDAAVGRVGARSG